MTDRPRHPYAVLAASICLPGSGHVLLGMTQRGLTFLFFTVVFGWVSLRLMPESASFFSRHVGGILVYGLSVIDAYRLARLRWEIFQRTDSSHHSP